MNKKRIAEVVEFFYSSYDNNVVPLRLSVATGQYSGFDLTPESTSILLDILSNATDLTAELKEFVSRLEV